MSKLLFLNLSDFFFKKITSFIYIPHVSALSLQGGLDRLQYNECEGSEQMVLAQEEVGWSWRFAIPVHSGWAANDPLKQSSRDN